MERGLEISQQIRLLLDTMHLQYDFTTHEETPTSADAARVRGTKPEEGVKALIFRGKRLGTQYMLCLPGNRKVNIKAAEKYLGESIEMEKPEVILDKYGLIIGGIPPFGSLLGIATYTDPAVLIEPRSAFNCGLRTHSITMASKDLIVATDPVLVEISKPL